MKVKANVDFLHDELGRVKAGAEIDVNAEQAASVLDYIDGYETKVVHAQPKPHKPKKADK